QHMKHLNSLTTPLTAQEVKISDHLLSVHNPKSPYDRIPAYKYDQLEKGIICSNCYSNSSFIVGDKCKCNKCNFSEPMTRAILRSVQEFKWLFPAKKITTNTIHHWCRIIPSKRTIRRILKENLHAIGTGRATYYE